MDITSIAMKIIANAGSSRSYSLEALQKAEEGNFAEADKLLDLAQQSLLEAHRTHSELLTAEAKGEKLEFSIFLLHAESHLNLAEQSKDMVDAFYRLYKKG